MIVGNIWSWKARKMTLSFWSWRFISINHPEYMLRFDLGCLHNYFTFLPPGSRILHHGNVPASNPAIIGCIDMYEWSFHSSPVPQGIPRQSGWWLGTLLFFHISGIIIPFEFHIFQRGWNHQSAIVTYQASTRWYDIVVHCSPILWFPACCWRGGPQADYVELEQLKIQAADA